MPRLIITADDYGLWPSYDAGILEAARAGAVDSVGAMVLRAGLAPEALAETGVEVGLHLELEPPEQARARPDEREIARRATRRQMAAFADAFGRAPAFLDGHHHRHAAPGLAAVVAREAATGNIPVRSVDARHRRLVRCQGVATPDQLVGRLAESAPSMPAEIEGLVSGRSGGGVVEWMVHPGHPDPGSGSAYDAGRAEDLRLLLELLDAGALRALRATHAAALS